MTDHATDQVATTETSEEDRSKDQFFVKLGDLAESMIAAHGSEFTMGAMIIAARFIAEGKPLKGGASGTRDCEGNATFAMTGLPAPFGTGRPEWPERMPRRGIPEGA